MVAAKQHRYQGCCETLPTIVELLSGPKAKEELCDLKQIALGQSCIVAIYYFSIRLFLGVANSYCTHLGEKYRPNLKTLLQVQKSDPKFRTVIKKPTNVLETRN